ncbi:MAG: beta-lactamase family protein [Candidatus Adiutrix sp.]|nr:beta-lactamase family protein [Candidatus Adiutrix sp.]
MSFESGQVEDLIKRGLAAGAFPGAVAFWGRPGAVPSRAWAGQRGLSRNRQAVSPDLIYDLASLSKVLATTSLAMILHQRGRLDLDRPLADSPLPALAAGQAGSGADWRRLTPSHLLSHQSGLRPWRPLYRLAGASLAERRLAALRAIWAERPQAAPGQRSLYSDLNFILLGFLLEELEGQSLETLFNRELARPLALSRAGFRPRSGPLAPTEDGFRYGGPVAHPEALWRGPTPLGRPHDDNAAWLGGAAGHAGLFAPAADLWALAADWALAWRSGRGLVFQRETLAHFIRTRPSAEDSGRPLGFNLAGAVEALAGSVFPAGAVGHLGYTGTSLWWDREKDFLWIFLSNRVHLRAWNPAWEPAAYLGGPKRKNWTSPADK